MIPTRQQFKKWSYPTKFGFISFFFSFAVTVFFWLFPDAGKQLIAAVVTEDQQEIKVPGRNAVERQINLAKILGIALSDPSTEFAVAVVFVRPIMSRSLPSDDGSDNIVALSNASPLRSADQDLVFAPGKCRFLGVLRWLDRKNLKGEAVISTLSCVLDNGDSYGFGNVDGPAIGFVAPLDEPMSRSLSLVEEGWSTTLPLSGQYLVRLHSPLHGISYKGKSENLW